MLTLKEMLIEAGYLESEMDHHESDLYVYVTPLTTEVIEDGIVKGDWFYRKDGSKKKTTANGFKFIEKIGG